MVVIGAGGCTGPPPAPLGLTATVSGRFVSLSWTASGTITGLVLEVGSAPGASNVGAFLLDRSARAVGDNAPPGVYFVRVRAMNSCGSGGASNELTISVSRPCERQSTVTCDRPESLTVVALYHEVTKLHEDHELGKTGSSCFRVFVMIGLANQLRQNLTSPKPRAAGRTVRA